MARTRGLAEILARRSGQATGQNIGITKDMFEPQAGPATSSPFVRNVYPPWVYKLPMSQDFNQNNFATVLAAVAGTVVTPVTFQLPPTFVGYIQIVGIYVLSPTATTDITFTLRMNGAPVQGWDNLATPPGVANFFVQNFADVQQRIVNGGKVTMTVTNNAATGPWTVGAKVAGWYHPEGEEQRIYGSL
jgi:hypothetical protein